MKITYKFIVLLAILLATKALLAQDVCSNSDVKQYVTGDMFMYYYVQYNGSPMLNTDWYKGSFTLVSGQKYTNVDINYDIYKDDFLYFNAELRRIVKVDKNIIVDFWIKADKEPTTQNIRVINFGDADSATVISGYVFELVNDTISLYAKKKKLIQFDNTTYSGTSKLGEFYEKTFYYFKHNNTLYTLPRSKRQLAKHFVEHNTEIRKFIVKNRYSLKNSAHLVSIFDEINRLYYQ